jgi:hypothetical protein
MGASPDLTGDKQDTRFKPGKSGNPAGRPKGARAKLGEDFLKKLLADFQEHGEDVIAKVRDEKPADYIKVVASILPKEIELGEETQDVLATLFGRIDGRTRAVVPVEREGVSLQ